MNHFEMSLSSSSYFVTDLKIEYFIISREEVDCGRVLEKISFSKPLETRVSKALSHSEYNYKSSSGYKYSSKDGDSKAGAVIFVYNSADEVVAQYATSNKLLDEFRGMERALRDNMKSENKQRLTIHKNNL